MSGMTTTPPALPRELRDAASLVLNALSAALAVAAAVAFVLMLVVWARTDDFPGQYWFAVLPPAAASLTLFLFSARAYERP